MRSARKTRECRAVPDMAETPTALQPVHRIVIVGGGAGGLPLATMLGDKLGDKKPAWLNAGSTPATNGAGATSGHQA